MRNSGIWAGKRDSRRHSTTSFRANVVLAKVRSFIILPDRESALPPLKITMLTFLVKNGKMKLSGKSIF